MGHSEPQPASTSRVRLLVVAMIFLLAALTYLDRVCIASAMEVIQAEFHLTKRQVGLVLSAFTLAYAAFEVPSGWLGDRYGTRLALTRIVLWWSLFTALTGAALGFWSLVLMRFLFGMGEAGAYPNIARTVSRWFPGSQQGRAMSVAFVGQACGAALSSPLVVSLLKVQSWRWTFVEFGLLGVIWAVVWYVTFRDRPEDHPLVSPAELADIRSQLPAESRVHERVPWRRLFLSGNLWAIGAMYFAFGFGLYFYVTWLPQYLRTARGFSQDDAKWLAALPWLASIAPFWLGGWATDRLATRTGNLRLARCGVGAAGYAISALALVVAGNVTHRGTAVALLVLALCGQTATISAAWSVCLDVGRQHAGVVAGFMNTIGNLGGVLTPLVVADAVERFHSWNMPLFIMAGVFVFGIGMWYCIDPRQSVASVADRPFGR